MAWHNVSRVLVDMPTGNRRTRAIRSVAAATATGLVLTLTQSAVVSSTAFASVDLLDLLAPPAWTAADQDQYEVNLRAKMGFDSSMAAILSARLLFPDAVADLGIPITPIEALQVAARDLLSSGASDVIATLSDSPTYAGAWMEQTGNGVFHLLVTATPTLLEQAAIRLQLPLGAAVVFDVVTTSMHDLNARVAAITEDVALWEAQGITIQSVSVEEKTNGIRLDLLTNAPTGAEATLTSAYGGDRLTFVRRGPGRGPCRHPDGSPHWSPVRRPVDQGRVHRVQRRIRESHLRHHHHPLRNYRRSLWGRPNHRHSGPGWYQNPGKDRRPHLRRQRNR